MLLELPVEWHRIHVVVPQTVEPDCSDLSVVGQKLGELVVHKLIVVRPVGLGRILSRLETCSAGGVILAGPVDMGIIEIERNTLLFAFVGKLFENIAAERSHGGGT